MADSEESILQAIPEVYRLFYLKRDLILLLELV